MRVFAGTSGFSYKEWKGSFYPEKLPAGEMLSYYSTRLPAVEINNTLALDAGDALLGVGRGRPMVHALAAMTAHAGLAGLVVVGREHPDQVGISLLGVCRARAVAALAAHAAAASKARGELRKLIWLLRRRVLVFGPAPDIPLPAGEARPGFRRQVGKDGGVATYPTG